MYSKCTKRTKRAVGKIILSDAGWNEEHVLAFNSLKQALANSVTLAHPDNTKQFCLLTDASDKFWAGILTQICRTEVDKIIENQPQEPLAFLSGSFTGSQANWSTAEKEACAIIFCLKKLDYLLLRPEGFLLFTDHSNLVFIFNPDQGGVHMSRNAINKVRRWCMTLTSFHYTIAHIPGLHNYWADLLSRWGNANATVADSQDEERHMQIARLFTASAAPQLDPEFKWPSHTELKQIQGTPSSRASKKIRSKETEWLMEKSSRCCVDIEQRDQPAITHLRHFTFCTRRT